jgi:hypothetical protein
VESDSNYANWRSRGIRSAAEKKINLINREPLFFTRRSTAYWHSTLVLRSQFSTCHTPESTRHPPYDFMRSRSRTKASVKQPSLRTPAFPSSAIGSFSSTGGKFTRPSDLRRRESGRNLSDGVDCSWLTAAVHIHHVPCEYGFLSTFSPLYRTPSFLGPRMKSHCSLFRCSKEHRSTQHSVVVCARSSQTHSKLSSIVTNPVIIVRPPLTPAITGDIGPFAGGACLGLQRWQMLAALAGLALFFNRSALRCSQGAGRLPS